MKRRRALLFTLSVVLALCAACGVWLHRERQQYAFNRQLIAALLKGDTKQALVLVNVGADPNTRCSPIPAPTFSQLLKQLLHHTPPPVSPTPTALMLACGAYWPDPPNDALQGITRHENLPLIEAMLAHGANVNARRVEQVTVLHDAVSRHRLPTLELLLQHGAEVNVQDKAGRTPLTFAAANDSAALVHALLAHGANPNIGNAYGETALYSVLFGHDPVHILPDLLAHGGDPNLPEDNGYTPLQWAQRMKRPDLVRLFKHGTK
jgi:hypothetical protein